MNIAIIGAGFTGLAAAYRLLQLGHRVTVFEKDSRPGGLAIGYKEKDWEWTLEKHYHHWFSNDDSILNLAKEVHFDVLLKRPKTSVYIDGSSYQLDSPLALLTLPKLPPIDRLRMAVIFALLFRFNPFWQPLEKVNATKYLPKLIGKRTYKLLWEPQLKNKMGKYIDDISLAWFWARINKRTPSLVYPKGGFLHFAEYMTDIIRKKGGKIHFGQELVEIKTEKNIRVKTKNDTGNIEAQLFDKVIVTLPTHLFLKVTPELPETYKKKLLRLQGLSATNMVLRMKKQFLKDNTYWLSICDTSSNIMVLVEHTNFMDKKHYNNEHLMYIGNYMPIDDVNFSKKKEDLLRLYDPFLRKINPDYKKELIDYEVFRAPFAQPIIPTNYSKHIPPFTTPLKNVYLANMQQVYPWDRGTNYAVELGEKITKLITDEKS